MFARQGCKTLQAGDHARSLQAVVAREAGRNTLARRPCEEVAGRVYSTGRQARLLARQAGSSRNPHPLTSISACNCYFTRLLDTLDPTLNTYLSGGGFVLQQPR